MDRRGFDIIDAHTHFFSYTWFQNFCALAGERFAGEDGVAALAAELGWETPPPEPRVLGKRWVEEQDRYGLRKQVLFASKPNDAEPLSAAVQAFPDRLVGYGLIDPMQPQAREQAHYCIHILGMKGLLMFPAMHRFHAYDERVWPIYEEAAAAEVPVFIHFGHFRLPILERLGIEQNIDVGYSNPLDLRRAMEEFPEIDFIVPHFGCGRFEEALEIARASERVYFDTSSSNAWIEPPLTLEEVFRRSLHVLGPERLLFGTDSSAFPRGWRKEIFDQQAAILETLRVPEEDQQRIFGGNVARLLGIAL